MALSEIHKERIRTLAKYLREKVPPEHFEMSSWWSDHRTKESLETWDLRERAGSVSASDEEAAEAAIKDCGTAACIAGWAALLWPKDIGLDESRMVENAGGFLGLTYVAADALFLPPGIDENNARRRFTVRRAIETLERLADTGKVQWFKTDKPVEA